MKQNKGQRARRLIAVILSVMALMAIVIVPAGAKADGETVPVYLNGEEIVKGKAKLINGITYVPLRAFCDEGAPHTYSGAFKIYWDGSTGSAVVEGNGLYLIATQGKCYITVNGRYFYTVGDILNVGGSIYVPIRPMAKALGFELTWDAELRAVSMISTGERVKSASEVYSSDDVYWLSRIISAESGAEPFRGKIAVGNVVMNRVRSSAYPNSIWGVIFDRKHGTQFTPAVTGTIYRTPTADSVIAAKICLEGYSISDTALFFLNPRIATNFWIVKNRPYEFSIGNHDFYG